MRRTDVVNGHGRSRLYVEGLTTDMREAEQSGINDNL